MVERGWVSVPESELPLWCSLINQQYPVDLFDVDTARVEYCALPFYNSYALCRFTSGSTTPTFIIHALYDHVRQERGDKAGFKLLNGDVEPVYEVNDLNQVVLSPETLMEYLQFFFEFVYPPDGPFCLIQNADDLRGLEDVPYAFRREIEIRAKLPVIQPSSTGGWVVDVHMGFKNHLYRIRMNVTLAGVIDIIDEKLLSELPPQADWKV